MSMLCKRILAPAGSLVRQRLLVPTVTLPRTPSHVARAGPSFAATYSEMTATPQHPQLQPAPPAVNSRVYTSYYVYKSRAAMCIQLVPPTFSDKGDAKALERDGVMLLEFASANPQQPGAPAAQPGAINRTYNWGSKVLFALSPTEIGNILAGDVLTDKGLTLYHDPAKLGKVGEPKKRLTLNRLQDGAINFQLVAGNDNISVAVTRGEFEVFKSIAQYAIPRLLGFNALFSS